MARLCAFGHSVGKLLQYRHQGFLPNKRQQLSGGLAALELAQTLRNVVGLCMTPEHMTVSMSVSSIVGFDESCDEEMCAMW